MKIAAVVVFVILTLVGAACFIKATYEANQLTANLTLADDASTPQQKAEFLRKFLVDIEEAEVAKHSARIFKTERNKVANQKIVLASLIERCDELAKLNKESMGYAQGMTQITGQEFDHTMNSIASIYENAYVVHHYSWIIYEGTLLWAVLAFVAGIWAANENNW